MIKREGLTAKLVSRYWWRTGLLDKINFRKVASEETNMKKPIDEIVENIVPQYYRVIIVELSTWNEELGVTQNVQVDDFVEDIVNRDVKKNTSFSLQYAETKLLFQLCKRTPGINW